MGDDVPEENGEAMGFPEKAKGDEIFGEGSARALKEAPCESFPLKKKARRERGAPAGQQGGDDAMRKASLLLKSRALKGGEPLNR